MEKAPDYRSRESTWSGNRMNPERFPETGAMIIAMPMKISGGSGVPVRVITMLPRANELISPDHCRDAGHSSLQNPLAHVQ